jgi:glycerol-3-phosphate acyltransferase PlsY
MISRLLSIALGYCFGLFQTAFIIGKIKGIDLRHEGSGNLGSTNVLRVLGKKDGIICLVGDIAKTMLACLAAHAIFSGGPLYQGSSLLYMIYAGFGAVLGHDYPFYLHFKGGKGIAAMAGLIIILDGRIALMLTVIFFLIVWKTRYVSLGSLTAMALFLVMWIVFNQAGLVGLSSELRLESYLMVAVAVALSFIQHRANIKRLVQGTENKLGAKKK